MVLDGTSSQKYPVNAGVSQGSIPSPTLFLLYINDLPDDICNIAIYTDDILYFKCDQASELWQQLQFASELPDTVDQGRKWLVDFSAGKTELVSFDQSNSTGAIDVKMDGSAPKEKSSLIMLGLTFISKLNCGSIAKALSLLLKLHVRN